MSAVYGLQRGNADDAMTILNLESNAQEETSVDYDTLAEYQVSDITLQPSAPSFGFPSRWSLIVQTQLLGFNQPDGQSLYFDKSQSDLRADGYVTYPLSSHEFSDMLKGGMYDNAPEYVQKLKDSLLKQRFYRQTSVNLSTVRIRDDYLSVSAGDFITPEQQQQRAKQAKTYLIGEELSPYWNFGQKASDLSNQRTNFTDVLKQHLTELVKNPISEVWTVDLSHVNDIDRVQVPANNLSDWSFNDKKLQMNNTHRDLSNDQSQVLNNKSKTVTSDKSMDNSPLISDNSSDVTNDGSSNYLYAASNVSNSENSVKSSHSNVDSVASAANFEGSDDATVMDALTKLKQMQKTFQSQPKIRKKDHPYVDDYGKALEEQRNRRNNTRRRTANVENTPSQSKDNDLYPG